ncbi:MAG: S8 family serine peptidase [Bdellovibrionales bacterium]|nr:S8 family serine peptidase [Bdellovibrionales bacterium]
MIKPPSRQRQNDRRARSSKPRFQSSTPLLIFALVLLLSFTLFRVQRTHRINASTPRTLSSQKVSEGALVAVIDTGIDMLNPRLKRNLWINPGEFGKDASGNSKATNGIDDDQNGYTDDVHGWNFVTNSPNVSDTHGHGTHVASLIVDPPGDHDLPSHAPILFQGQLMVLKYYDAATIELNLERSVRAMHYAAQMNAAIINFSGGGFGQNPAEQRAVELAEAKNILIVAAAGNEKMNSDRTPFFPASYHRSNILSVGAHSKDGSWLPASNWGKNSVDIAALGENVSGFVLEGKRGKMTGTSQATAIATGIASRLWKLSTPLRVPYMMREYLIQNSRDSEKMKNRLASEGPLDQNLALVRASQIATEPKLSPIHFLEAFSQAN